MIVGLHHASCKIMMKDKGIRKLLGCNWIVTEIILGDKNGRLYS